MPIVNCNPPLPCGRAWAGCVPVAMGQIMRFHTHPGNYNYGDMLPNQGNIHNATLLRDIFFAFPANQRSISCIGTGIEPSANYASVFKNSFGYSSAVQGGFNVIIVRNNLNLGRPVLLGGLAPSGPIGHMWVTDGYQRTVFCETGNAYTKLHMSWGWPLGAGNGFYSFNNWSGTLPNGQTFNFNRNKMMIYNIMP